MLKGSWPSGDIRAPSSDELPPLALLAEPEVLDGLDDRDGEGVVDRGVVDVGRVDTGLLEGPGSGPRAPV